MAVKPASVIAAMPEPAVTFLSRVCIGRLLRISGGHHLTVLLVLADPLRDEARHEGGTDDQDGEPVREEIVEVGNDVPGELHGGGERHEAQGPRPGEDFPPVVEQFHCSLLYGYQ